MTPQRSSSGQFVKGESGKELSMRTKPQRTLKAALESSSFALRGLGFPTPEVQAAGANLMACSLSRVKGGSFALKSNSGTAPKRTSNSSNSTSQCSPSSFLAGKYSDAKSAGGTTRQRPFQLSLPFERIQPIPCKGQ